MRLRGRIMRPCARSTTAATAADMPDLERLADIKLETLPRIVRIDLNWGKTAVHLEGPLSTREDWLALLRSIHRVLDQVKP